MAYFLPLAQEAFRIFMSLPAGMGKEPVLTVWLCRTVKYEAGIAPVWGCGVFGGGIGIRGSRRDWAGCRVS